MKKLRRVTIIRAATAAAVAVALSCAFPPGAHAGAGQVGYAGQASQAAGLAGAVRGLDISAYQHAGSTIHWQRLARDGLRFVSIKTTEGTYYRNPFYVADARAAAAAGLAVLPYVFANPARGGGAPTARFGVKAASAARGAARLPLVVDLENDPYKKNRDCWGRSVRAIRGWIGGFLNQAHALTGHWPIVYTTAAWWRECTGATRQFQHDPLWLAAFGKAPGAVPAPWSQWAFWQYDDNGALPGIGPVDLDYYRPTGGLPSLNPAKHKPAKHKPARPRHKQAKHKQAKKTAKAKAKKTAKPGRKHHR